MRAPGASDCPGPALPSTSSHVLCMTSSNMNIKVKAIKLLEENTEKYFCDLEVGKDFLGHKKL